MKAKNDKNLFLQSSSYTPGTVSLFSSSLKSLFGRISIGIASDVPGFATWYYPKILWPGATPDPAFENFGT